MSGSFISVNWPNAADSRAAPRPMPAIDGQIALIKCRVYLTHFNKQTKSLRSDYLLFDDACERFRQFETSAVVVALFADANSTQRRK